MGTGHLMRCLTLANALKEQGYIVHFACRGLKGNVSRFVEEQGHSLHLLPAPEGKLAAQPDDIKHAQWLEVQWQQDSKETFEIIQNITGQIEWMIVDNYALDFRWENSLRQYVKKIMVIDDLADRKHDCDILLDQNYYPNLNVRYTEFLPFVCRTFFGPKYAILRPEFLQERQNLHQRNGIVQRILIFFGGVDPSNETGKALKAIEILNRSDLNVDVIIGSSNPNKSDILDQCKSIHYITCHGYVKNMARLMAKADLAIGAGGTATWERCCLGLPSIIEIVAENQTALANGIEQTNAGHNCGVAQNVTPELIAETITKFIVSKKKLLDYSKAAFNLVDGEGASRIVHAMQIGKIHLREAEQLDCELLWKWANSSEVRQASFNSNPILWEEHTQWFATKLQDNKSYIFIAEDEKENLIGQIRFEINNDTATINYSVQYDYRGLGFGEVILRIGIQKLVDLFEMPITFHGKVRPENIASQKIFMKVGFSKINTKQSQVWFELKR
jgi:UDP-2,4-diacetamido-2,4,6-trideoxy-beta-L-altropyranose hydrolase